MKKLLLITLLCTTTISFAQEKEEITLKKNELKLNTVTLIALKAFDVSYERIIDSESSFGVSLFLKASEDEVNTSDFFRTFSFTPFYRRYFSSKYARGFFIEGFAMIANSKDYDYNIDNFKKDTDFALGIAAGAKFITKKGFIAEIFLGVGRKMGAETDAFDIPLVGRGGITLGYQF